MSTSLRLAVALFLVALSSSLAYGCAYDTASVPSGNGLSALPIDPACACPAELEQWLTSCIDDVLAADVGEGYTDASALALCTPSDAAYPPTDAYDQNCAPRPDRSTPAWCEDGFDAFLGRHVRNCVTKIEHRISCP